MSVKDYSVARCYYVQGGPLGEREGLVPRYRAHVRRTAGAGRAVRQAAPRLVHAHQHVGSSYYT